MKISQIKEKLQKPLLGVNAQRKMSPKGRDLTIPKDKSNYKKSAVLLVGYQAEGTTGKKLLEERGV